MPSKFWVATGKLRWVKGHPKATGNLLLQYELSDETGDRKWDDVPVIEHLQATGGPPDPTVPDPTQFVPQEYTEQELKLRNQMLYGNPDGTPAPDPSAIPELDIELTQVPVTTRPRDQDGKVLCKDPTEAWGEAAEACIELKAIIDEACLQTVRIRNNFRANHDDWLSNRFSRLVAEQTR